MKPAPLVIAGPNGAGKTTVTTHLRAEHWSEGVEYLNPDEIARDRFGDWNAPNAVQFRRLSSSPSDCCSVCLTPRKFGDVHG